MSSLLLIPNQVRRTSANSELSHEASQELQCPIPKQPKGTPRVGLRFAACPLSDVRPRQKKPLRSTKFVLEQFDAAVTCPNITCALVTIKGKGNNCNRWMMNEVHKKAVILAQANLVICVGWPLLAKPTIGDMGLKVRPMGEFICCPKKTTIRKAPMYWPAAPR